MFIISQTRIQSQHHGFQRELATEAQGHREDEKKKLFLLLNLSLCLCASVALFFYGYYRLRRLLL